MEYEIRIASETDIAYLPAIEQAASELFVDTAYAEETSQACLTIEFLRDRQRNDRVWVAIGDGIPVGFAVVTEIGENAHLHELSVHPGHQRNGLGRRLVEAVRDQARASGFAAISLSTYSDVSWSAPFYASLGFRVVNRPGVPYADLRREESGSGLDISKRVIMFLDL